VYVVRGRLRGSPVMRCTSKRAATCSDVSPRTHDAPAVAVAHGDAVAAWQVAAVEHLRVPHTEAVPQLVRDKARSNRTVEDDPIGLGDPEKAARIDLRVAERLRSHVIFTTGTRTSVAAARVLVALDPVDAARSTAAVGMSGARRVCGCMLTCRRW
jgi:hypothetical protein